MIRMLCENRTCKTEMKGTGVEILEDALNAVHGIYSALYKNDRKLALFFTVMVKAKEKIIFNMDESELLEFTDKMKGIKKVVKPEDDEQLMEEIRKDIKELTRKLMEE